MGWVTLLLLAGAVAAALIRWLRPRATLVLVGAAALLAACAGYGWQGRPSLPGRPTPPSAVRRAPPGLFAEERHQWMERMGRDPQVLDTADAFVRHGDADYAVGILRGALSQSPRSAVLWTGLGNALTCYADGLVTPAARYAFARAAALAPNDPAPIYFLGLALAESGDLAGARGVWKPLLAGRRLDPERTRMLATKLAMIAELDAIAR